MDSLFDLQSITYVVTVVVVAAIVSRYASDMVSQIGDLLRSWAESVGAWAARPATYTQLGVVAGLFALSALIILGITDQNILSFSFWVLFPGDKVMRVLAGLAYTLCEIMVGHLVSETIGFSRLYLDRLFSPRQRAILFVFFVVALGILLSNEYSLAYRRSILMAAAPQETATVIGQQAADIGPTADDIATAHASGLVAFAVGLADVVIGFALAAALGVIGNVFDGLTRVLAAVLVIVLRLVSIAVTAVSRLLRFPQEAAASVGRIRNAQRAYYLPLSVYRKVKLLEPTIDRKRITYADALELIRLANELDRDDLTEDEWQSRRQQYDAIVRICTQASQQQTPRTDP